MSGGCLVAFGFVFLIAGLAAGWFLVVKPVVGLLAARGWVETDCIILECKLESHAGDDTTTYSVEVRYEYEFNGATHVSDRYSFSVGSSDVGVDAKRAFVNQHKPGTKAVCFVDPNDPAEATFVRGFTWDLLFGLIPLVFVAAGAGIVYAGFRSRKSSNPDAPIGELIVERRTVVSAKGSTLPDHDISGQPVELKTASRFGKFGCLLFVALFGNGIVSVFVVEAVKSFQKDRPEWFLTVFLIPFVLIGLALLGGVIHAFLGIFNPKPRIRISSAAIPLGGVLRLEWMIGGNVNRIGDLRIYLKGREEATYRRGTSTHTDTSIFAELEIARLNDPRSMRAGKGELIIPPDTMHSAECVSNKIVWSLIVSGDIKNFPDIEDEFPVVILPGKVLS